MRLLGRALGCVFCVVSTVVSAQEFSGARSAPVEVYLGKQSEIEVAFRTLQSANGDGTWSCGLTVNFGDGRNEFHRVESSQVPLKLTHTYGAPGNYAVTLEGKLQFRGLSTVLPCTGDNVSLAIVVRPEDYALREAAERAAQQEALNRAAADREAAQRASNQARADREAAERSAQKAAVDRATAEKRRAAASRAAAAARSTAPAVPIAPAQLATPALENAPKPPARPQKKVGSATDL